MLKEVVEWCNHCGHENILQWDLEQAGWEIHCACCGEKLLLCDECLASGSTPTPACPSPCGKKAL